MARILVVDLEATCSDDGSIPPEEMEIIEIGACWVTERGVVLERFQHLAKPLVRPALTPFCKKLIGITQEEIDQAPLFPVAAQALQAFVREVVSSDTVWMSWGNYDHKQLTREAQRHEITMPLAMPHQNAKRLFAKVQRIGKEVGMARACALAGIPLEGQHHRGLDDAVSIAKLMPWVLGHATLSGQSHVPEVHK
ncbi:MULTISPECIES: exonuclease domain-containing protein [Herbaspirillum]|uniref:3'-5' exonuclease n=2 Tax=Herbaspirillum huttiense TaxID=863372 RepID=A0AAJ2LWX9_9BURK|nr:3'-5' exonuclease [Herbaspirillum huttiense]MCI1014229.1 exonuclease domain-containing protein [Herbaspirillum sp. C7C2]MDR9839750.1 3'-5' exonuclease [Herbaspirillum huttiense]MEE1639651.1 3'-5' exonuclease [Herbaspirillum huttiense NC40101]